MVEYVLGGSPTNKESPLSGLEPRLHSLKFEDNDKVVSITTFCMHGVSSVEIRLAVCSNQGSQHVNTEPKCTQFVQTSREIIEYFITATDLYTHTHKHTEREPKIKVALFGKYFASMIWANSVRSASLWIVFSRRVCAHAKRHDIFINFQQQNIYFSHNSSRPFQSNDDKEKANSPFESNGIKKDDQVNATNGVAVNGIDDDKGFK